MNSTNYREACHEGVNGSVPSNEVFCCAQPGEFISDLGMQCGGWTIDWQGDHGNVTHGGTTLLAAIKKSVSAGTEVSFSPDGNDLKSADAIIVAIGEPPYAEMKGDRTNLDLSSADVALIEKAKATGAPVVTILYSGRPLVLGAALDQSDAFVAAWLPGTEGLGMTDVLFGDCKPTGKLPCAWPRQAESTGGESVSSAAFPFGYGLTFAGEVERPTAQVKTASAKRNNAVKPQMDTDGHR